MPWKYKPEQRSSTRGSSEKAAKSALLSVLGFSPEASLASVAGAALSEVLSVATKADAETSCSKTEVLILIIAPLNFASGQGPIPMYPHQPPWSRRPPERSHFEPILAARVRPSALYTLTLPSFGGAFAFAGGPASQVAKGQYRCGCLQLRPVGLPAEQRRSSSKHTCNKPGRLAGTEGSQDNLLPHPARLSPSP
eukprot:CAMPEP_0195040630 /NCGR_PEP_ID=MMETSP0326_2-20130528/80436_1 /TAXON_ID=2866 ORGANISM="Crypthecodinium cohnii, Strain Seligo" /NCGR_SAMPLE_ID=MMETSP0326_2 /ASSEMBLY_ACC=CAM_ASM_000348 /LENGTH=194 /DNA_ID=CAMNT_0040067561 /DNA_START=87 /DNA_END=671 /DNA_ORIENTATION=-